MLIKEIKFKNMISNEEEISFSFIRKIREEDKDRFFNKPIEKKPRSKTSYQGILKTLSLIGKNASYKTSTLTSVNRILDFIINFKKNAKEFAKGSIDFNKAMEWYEQEKLFNTLEDKISVSKIMDEYLKNINKNKKPEEYKNEYSRSFYETNAFNKDKPIKIMVIFYDKKLKKDITLNISLMVDKKKLISSSLINNKPIDLFKDKINNTLNFKHDFASFEFYNINGRRRFWGHFGQKENIFLKSALEYLFFETYNEDMDRLISFLKILDPSITSIKCKIHKERKRIIIKEITREYNDISENISIGKLSTGTQIFITYLYFILKNDFIIIDELEQSLHFKLVELLLDIARAKQKQVLFSTHSPIIIEKLLRKNEVYIPEFDSNNKLQIKRGDKIFRERDNFLIKYLNDLVSNIEENDLDRLKMDFYD